MASSHAQHAVNALDKLYSAFIRGYASHVVRARSEAAAITYKPTADANPYFCSTSTHHHVYRLFQ
jgi:hypothetical protein